MCARESRGADPHLPRISVRPLEAVDRLLDHILHLEHVLRGLLENQHHVEHGDKHDVEHQAAHARLLVAEPIQRVEDLVVRERPRLNFVRPNKRLPSRPGVHVAHHTQLIRRQRLHNTRRRRFFQFLLVAVDHLRVHAATHNRRLDLDLKTNKSRST